MKMNEPSSKKDEFKPWAKWILFGLAVALWIGITFAINKLFLKGNEIGDSFGAVNALFSGLAFAGLIVTIQQQWEELKLTREEMKTQSQHLQSQSITLKDHERLMALSNYVTILSTLIKEEEDAVKLHLTSAKFKDVSSMAEDHLLQHIKLCKKDLPHVDRTIKGYHDNYPGYDFNERLKEGWAYQDDDTGVRFLKTIATKEALLKAIEHGEYLITLKRDLKQKFIELKSILEKT